MFRPWCLLYQRLAQGSWVKRPSALMSPVWHYTQGLNLWPSLWHIVLLVLVTLLAHLSKNTHYTKHTLPGYFVSQCHQPGHGQPLYEGFNTLHGDSWLELIFLFFTQSTWNTQRHLCSHMNNNQKKGRGMKSIHHFTGKWSDTNKIQLYEENYTLNI